MTIEELVARLDGVRRQGSGYMAKCPAHEDRVASLSIASGTKVAFVLKCHAGCSYEAIAAAIGIEKQEPRLVAKEQKFQVKDVAGMLVAVHVRRDHDDGTKTFLWQRPGGEWGLNGTPGSALPLFGIQNVPKLAVDREIVVTEGEKAAMALLNVKIPAVATVTGAEGTPSSASLEPLRGHPIVLWPDADELGRAHMARIGELLREVASSVRVIDWPDAPAKGDAANCLEPLPLIAAAKPFAGTYPEPEDFGLAVASQLAEQEYVVDVLRPGRITVVAAEEDSGKTFAIPIEMGVRLAAAGGRWSEMCEITEKVGVLYLSQMHPDDDIDRLDTACASLGVDRAALAGRYWRLSIFTAANGKPVLSDPDWRRFAVQRCQRTATKVIIFDTGTDATEVQPWGQEIAGVYRDLRAMIADYPELAILILVHLKKPQGRGQRRISDVLGEWGRLNDITILMESHGQEQTRISLLKRTNRKVWIATKRGGLLVEPIEPTPAGPKVSTDQFVAAVAAEPGKDSAYWAMQFGVTDRTIQRYAKAAAERIRTDEIRLKGSAKRSIYYPYDGDSGDIRRHTLLSPQMSPSAGGGDESTATADSAYIQGAVLSSSSTTPFTTSSGLTENEYQMLLDAIPGAEEVVQ